MADNTTLNSGTGGDVIATDDVVGVKYQRVKLVDGTADSTAVIPGDATNGLDVDVTRVQGTVTTSATIAAALPAGTNNIGDVDVLTMPATAADGAAGLPATTVVVSGYDGTNVQALKTDANGILQVGDGGGTLSVDDGAGSLTVDGTVAVSSVGGTVTVDSELTTADLDTGAGTDTRAVVGLVLAESGGGQLVGSAHPVPISDNSGSITVDAVSLPLPTGAATAAKQPALGTAGTASADVITVQGIASMTALKVDGSAVTQPVSAASLPLPTGASTAAKQPALGTAGTPSADVITVQGVTSMTALKVDGSAVTQPVSGTVTANLATATTGGASQSMTISAASTNATNVKASAGQVYGLYVSNVNAAVRYLKLYNKASAPTVGTDTPVAVFAIPGNTAGAGFTIDFSNGLAFATGISFALTTGVANSDTGAVSANEHVVNIFYK